MAYFGGWSSYCAQDVDITDILAKSCSSCERPRSEANGYPAWDPGGADGPKR